MSHQDQQQQDSGLANQGDIDTVEASAPQSIWASFGADEVHRLLDNQWFNDEIISTMMSHIVAPSTKYHVLTPYQLIPGHHQQEATTVSSHLLARQALHQGHIRHILSIVNWNNNHWITVRLVLSTKACEVYDSMRTAFTNNAEQHDMASSLLPRFLPHLPPSLACNGHKDSEWQVILASNCPQQRNSIDCGIYSLLVAWHLARDLPLPNSVDGNAIALWRCAFASLGSLTHPRLADCLFKALDADIKPVHSNDDAATGLVPPPTLGIMPEIGDLDMRLAEVHRSLTRLREHQ